MPPKGATGAGTTIAVARAAAAFKGLGNNAATRNAEEAVDIDFLGTVTAESPKKDVVRAVSLLKEAGSKVRPKLVEASSQAVERVCQTSKGYKILLGAGGMEALLTAVQLKPDQGCGFAWQATIPFCRQTVAWLDELDVVDFPELANLLNIARLLGGFDEDVAVAALGAFERFTMHRRENTVAMLQNGVLQVIHQMIGAHRNPELVQEAFRVLFRICDLPAEAVVQHLAEEKSLITTAVEAMNQAPLNLRMQLSGLQLFGLWARYDDRRVNAAIVSTDVQAVVQRAVGDLGRSGLAHASSWISAVGGRMLAGALSSANGGG